MVNPIHWTRYATPTRHTAYRKSRYAILAQNIPSNPNVFNAINTSSTIPSNNDFPVGSPFTPGEEIWAHFLTGVSGDRPSWILNDTTTSLWPIANVETGLQGDVGGPHLKMWSIVIPINAVGIQIPPTTSIRLWRMGSVNDSRGPAGSNLVSPQTPSVGGTQAYLIGGCIGVNPGITVLPTTDMGLIISGQSAIVGAMAHGGIQSFNITVAETHLLGYTLWVTDSQPPVV